MVERSRTKSTRVTIFLKKLAEESIPRFVSPEDHLGAETAILKAKGDINGAMNKLAETETVILTLPKNAQRDASLRLLKRWKADLGPG